MSKELRLLELLEEAFESGLDPEECCAENPELIPELRRRLEACQFLRDELEALFPPEDGEFGPPSDSLPTIPGYEVESLLGRGGMGVVYKALHKKLKRPVAIKMLVGGPYSTPRELARLVREAEVEAALRHPNIVQIYDVAEFDGLPFFTMEYVEGGTLAEKLHGVPLPARDAASLLLTLARAVEAAHLAGIIHRDLKPNNVLLGRDGTPKIADFGLARHFGRQGQNTLTGAVIGSPSYMAPEQAAGKPGAGPAVDIYSLGAILYEMLTGRPPFQAETALETQRQVIAEEPVPPSRLNAKVPRDLETVCLKCLRKEPAHRYVAASALADDLERFSQGRPIRARPLWLGGRIWRWSRRNPSSAALVATALVALGSALVAGFWFQQQQANHRAEAALRKGQQQKSMEAALHEAVNLENEDRWPEARAVLESGLHLLKSEGEADFGEPLRVAYTNAAFVTELEEIRLLLSEGRTEVRGLTPPQLYANAFRRFGFPVDRLAPDVMAARIRSSPIRDTLIAYLHDWLYWIPENGQGPLRAVLDQSDGDEWRRAFRMADARHDNDMLLELANAPGAKAQPPLLISGLAGRLGFSGRDAAVIKFLRDAQLLHPDDFWINFMLATVLERERPQEAVGYCRALAAIRPTSDQAYVKLGRTLNSVGLTDEAIASLRKAFTLNPHCAAGRELAKALSPTGEWEEARAVWERSLEHDPTDHDAWYGYAQLCLFLGREEAYDHARKGLLDRFAVFGDDWVVAERTSLACLLKARHDVDAQRALDLADRAIAAGARLHADNAYLRFLNGLAIFRQGRFEQAIPILAAAADKLPNRAGPTLVLAMAQFNCGLEKEARRSLAMAIRNSNWEIPSANHPTAWVNHVFRREAEGLILNNPTAVLEGKRQPRDNDERLALLGICEFQRRYKTAAELFADAFAAEPDLARESAKGCSFRAAGEGQRADQLEVLNTECRYVAARCAALAGAGNGLGAENQARAHWRNQAVQWLQDDLVFWRQELQGDNSTHRALARQMLMLWRVEPDLAGLREPALERLPADEANRLKTFWKNVDATLFDSEISP
jgi:serine/threonine-protein kinase